MGWSGAGRRIELTGGKLGPDLKVSRSFYTAVTHSGFEMAERRRGTRVPQRWWEQSEIDWRLARGEAVAAAAQAGANEAASETPGSVLDSE